MNIFDLKEGMEFKDGEVKIQKIQHYVRYDRFEIKEISGKLAKEISTRNLSNILDVKTDEIDINLLKDNYKLEYSIYFTNVKDSNRVAICNDINLFEKSWC